jgi:hypothetical protein
MSRRPRRDNPWTSLVLGLVTLAFGLLFWLDHLDRINARDYLQWWPLALIAFGLAHVPARQWIAAAIWSLIGVWCLLGTLGYEQRYLLRIVGAWPLLISIAGIALIMQALRPGGSHPTHSFHALAVMAGNVRRMGSQELTGGDAIAVMGGVEIDLSSARLSGEAIIDVLAFWGGIEIRVPRGWNVINRVTGILGGFEDKSGGAPPGAPQLVIRGAAIMGGVEVKSS